MTLTRTDTLTDEALYVLIGLCMGISFRGRFSSIICGNVIDLEPSASS